ncbi:hypothetical protein ACFLVO_02985 [Chloroflexota bacterium]
MARKAIVDKDVVLSMLKEGKTTQSIAEGYGVSRQAIDLYRRDFIRRGLLNDQRADRKKRKVRIERETETERTAPSPSPLDEQIDLIIAAFGALKRLPELEKELETYKSKYGNAAREIEQLREAEHKRQEQELHWNLIQRESNNNNLP